MISLNLATPKGISYKEELNQVEIKMIEGNITVLTDHIPFVSLIQNGYVKFGNKKVDIENGVVHFNDNNMYITYFE